MSLVVNNECRYDWFRKDDVPKNLQNNPSLLGRIYGSILAQGDGTGGTFTFNHILPVVQQVYGEYALVKPRLLQAYGSGPLTGGFTEYVNWDFQTGELVSSQIWYIRLSATIQAGQWGTPLPLMPEDMYIRTGGGLMSGAVPYFVVRYGTNLGTYYYQSSVYLTVHDERYI